MFNLTEVSTWQIQVIFETRDREFSLPEAESKRRSQEKLGPGRAGVIDWCLGGMDRCGVVILPRTGARHTRSPDSTIR